MLVIPRSREQGITRERVVTLKTLVIDPHSLFLAALGNLLSGHPLYAEVESTTNSSAGLHLIESGDYDLAFCDVTASPLSGPQVAAELRARGSSTRLILLADPDDFRLLLANLHCGASGFFTKNTSYEELLEGVEALQAGHFVVGHNLLQGTLDALANLEQPEPESSTKRLSQTEYQVLAQVGQARTIAEIAVARGISQKTVRNHLASIYRKMEIRSRTEAILLAARMGLSPE